MYLILIMFLSVFSIYASDNGYLPGPEYCANIAIEENGSWIDVPINYSDPSSANTKIYHWFLNNKYDPNKPTVVKVNGGPGATSHHYMSHMDIIADLGFNVLFFDQRGYVCSRPSTHQQQQDPTFFSINNTANDMDIIRKSLGIDKWIVLGASFGSPLSLKYSELYPENTQSVVIVGPALLLADDNNEQIRNNFSNKISRNALELNNAPDCLNQDEFNLYKDLIVNFSNLFGIKGIEIIHELLKSDSIENLFNELHEGTLYDDVYNMYGKKGLYLANESENYIWEPRYVDHILQNSDFDCVMRGECESESTFNIHNLNIKSPVYFFKGYYDGDFEKLNNAHKDLISKGTQSTIIKMHQNGHGPLSDTFLFGNEAEISALKNILKNAFLGKKVENKDIKQLNSTGTYKIDVY